MFLPVIILALPLFVLAQSQAPIEWGEARWLGIGTASDIGLSPIALMGDTIVFLGEHPGSPYYTGTVHSYDNGLTHGDWQWQDSMPGQSCRTQIAGSGGIVHVFDFPCLENNIILSRRSTDGGATWGSWRNWGGYMTDFRCTFASGEWIIGVTWYSPHDTVTTRANISTNRGQTWVYNQLVSADWLNVLENGIALTQSRIVLLALGQVSQFTRLSLGRRLRSDQAWEDFAELPNQPYGSGLWDATLAADTASEVVGVVSLWGGELTEGDLWFTRSADGGTIWEVPQMLTEHEPNAPLLRFSHCRVFQSGKLWGVAWKNVQHDIPERSGMYCRFSANHGKNWYPKQQLVSDARVVHYTSGQFIGNRMCVYWAANDSLGYHDFRMAEGIITPDMIIPMVTPVDLPPDTVPVEAQLLFLAQITDNDTLSREELRVRDADTTTTIPMEWTGVDYIASWTVPREGRYWCRIEGEDFWENVGSYPDTGWATFVTEGWVDGVDDFIVPPSSFSVSVFPNPFNPTTTLAFTLPHASHVTLTVFNLLGQEVYQSDLGRLEAGEHRQIFDGSALPSGVYVARVEAAGMIQMKKMILMR